MAEKINREIVASFSLPETALRALRKAVADNVALGIQDGFNQVPKPGKASEGSKKTDNTKKEASDKDLLSAAASSLSKSSQGASKSTAALTASLKGVAATVGIVITVINELLKAMESVETMSRQMVSATSLFTDKDVMGMMQKTGQTSTEATGTQRALDMLGISLSDIQTGMVTEAQMAAFETLRKEQITSIEAANEVSGSMFARWQGLALMVSDLSKRLEDTFVGTLGRSGAIDRLVTSLNPIIDFVFQIIEALLPIVPMLVDIVTAILPVFSLVLERLMIVLPPVVKAVGWLADLIVTILDPLVQLFSVFYQLTDWILPLLGLKAPAVASSMVSNQTNYNGSNSQSTSYVNNYNQPSNNLFNNDFVMAN